MTPASSPLRGALAALALAACLASGRDAGAEQGPPPVFALDGRTLVLNGFGERERWWTTVYRCALYLERRTKDLTRIKSPDTAKAIQIRVLTGVLPDRMPSDWRSMFREELSRELFGRLKHRYGDLGDNDVLVFAFSPGEGTTILVNGKRLLRDPGHDLMASLLEQWLGARPVSPNLRRLLLGLAE